MFFFFSFSMMMMMIMMMMVTIVYQTDHQQLSCFLGQKIFFFNICITPGIYIVYIDISVLSLNVYIIHSTITATTIVTIIVIIIIKTSRSPFLIVYKNDSNHNNNNFSPGLIILLFLYSPLSLFFCYCLPKSYTNQVCLEQERQLE